MGRAGVVRTEGRATVGWGWGLGTGDSKSSEKLEVLGVGVAGGEGRSKVRSVRKSQFRNQEAQNFQEEIEVEGRSEKGQVSGAGGGSEELCRARSSFSLTFPSLVALGQGVQTHHTERSFPSWFSNLGVHQNHFFKACNSDLLKQSAEFLVH